MKQIILFLFLIIAISYSLFPQTVYVSTTGHDGPTHGSSSDPLATISYALSRKILSSDGLTIYVYSGTYNEHVYLVNETKQSGEYEISFSGHNLASGVYIYRLTSGTYTQTKKMQFIK
jgi:hypothetical protein